MTLLDQLPFLLQQRLERMLKLLRFPAAKLKFIRGRIQHKLKLISKNARPLCDSFRKCRSRFVMSGQPFCRNLLSFIINGLTPLLLHGLQSMQQLTQIKLPSPGIVLLPLQLSHGRVMHVCTVFSRQFPALHSRLGMKR
ncbi:Uncharacterised protein [Mycobacterium tuberculosis]|nr:Uncharacterised protein [Mycobacterium tuberculosis]